MEELAGPPPHCYHHVTTRARPVPAGPTSVRPDDTRDV